VAFKRTQLGGVFFPEPVYNEIIGVRVNVSITLMPGTINETTIERQVTINARAQSDIASVVARATEWLAAKGQRMIAFGSLPGVVNGGEVYTVVEGGLEGANLFY